MTKTTEFNVFPATASHRPLTAAVMRSLGALILLAGLGGVATDARAQNTFGFASTAFITNQLDPGWVVGVSVTLTGLPVPDFPPAGDGSIVYSFDPPLPDGIRFDQTSRNITGKVDFDVPSGTTTHTYSASKGTATAENPITFMVRVVNNRPTANPGENQEVEPRALVTLDGSGSNNGADGDFGNNNQRETLTYLWTQAGGPTVFLSDATVLRPQFRAPKGNGAEKRLTFNLQVTDEADQQHTSATPVTITVGQRVAFDISSVHFAEGHTNAFNNEIQIRPDLESGETLQAAISLNYAVDTASSEATQDEDFTLSGTGTLAWAVGESGTKTIIVTPVDDAIDEPEEEVFLDYTTPDTTLAGFRDGQFDTEDSTKESFVIFDNDLGFAAAQADLTYVVGETVNVPLPAAENIDDPSATYSYTLTGANNASLPAGLSFNRTSRVLNGTITGTLATTEFTYTATDNSAGNSADPTQTGSQTFNITVKVAFDIESVAFAEGQTNSLSNAIRVTPRLEDTDTIHAPITVNYALNTGHARSTAAADADFTLGGSGTLTWAIGDSDTKTITVTIVDDAIEEPREEFVLDFTLANTGLAGFGTPLQDSAEFIGSIADNNLDFAAAQDDLTYVVGETVDVTLPAATDSDIPAASISYTLTGAGGASLPAGLTFNGTSRVLSGTTTRTLVPTDFTYTATDPGQSGVDGDPTQTGSQTFNIRVVTSSRPVLDGAITSRAWVTNTAITTLSLPEIIPATLQGTARYSLTPSLPEGLTFDADASPPTISGTPTALLSRTTFTYTAEDSRGIVTDSFDITVTAAPPTTFVEFVDPRFQTNEDTNISIEVRLSGTVRTTTLSIPLVVYPDGMATEGEDYTLPDPFEVNFAANAAANTVQTVTIPFLADDLIEFNEILTLGFGDLPDGVGVLSTGNSELPIYISDTSDGVVGLVSDGTVADPVPEGGTVDLTVRLDADIALDMTISLLLADDSAAGADDVTLPAPVTFPAGTQSGATHTFSVQIIDDTLFDGSRSNPTGAETLTLTLERIPFTNIILADDAANNYVSEVSLTIEDDDEPGTVTFGEQTIADQEILLNTADYRLELPEAMDGIPDDNAPVYTYTLTGTLPQGLTFDATSSPPVITGTASALQETAVTYSYTATDSTTPAGTTAPLTFTLTVRGVVFEVDPAGPGTVEDDVLPGKQTAKVDEPFTLELLNPQGVGPFTYLVEPTLPPGLRLDETTDPLTISGTPEEKTAEDEYTLTVTDEDDHTDTLTFTLEVRPPVDKDAVEETIKSGLAAFGRALGWGDVETVRDRLQRESTASGMRVSGLPTADGTSSLTAKSLLTNGASLELGLNATGGSASGIPALNAWVGARRAEIDAEPLSGHKQDGHLNSIRGGVDTRLDNDLLVGAGLGWHDGQLDFSREGGEVTGAMALDLITVNPYVGHSEDGMTVWGTVGAGTGELDYTEDGIGTLSSDVTLISGAAGIEFKRDWNGTELTGRGEGLYSTLDIDAATAGDLEIDDLSADVGGLRAEVEAARPFTRGAMMIRPHISTGLRYDLGDYADDLAYEVGGGLDVAARSFTLSVSGRTQLGSDSFDLSSYALSIAFDRDGDGLGLMLGLDQRVGQATFDPFAATLGTPAASGRELALEAGYGITLGRGVLMPYGEWQVSGSERTASESGLKWTGRDMTFGVRHSYGSGGTLAEERHVLGVTIDIGY